MMPFSQIVLTPTKRCVHFILFYYRDAFFYSRTVSVLISFIVIIGMLNCQFYSLKVQDSFMQPHSPFNQSIDDSLFAGSSAVFLFFLPPILLRN